jgi:hypothetical protein
MRFNWTVGGSSGVTGPAVFCDPCKGLAPIVVDDPRAFLAGQTIVALLALILLGLWALLLPQV